MIYLGNGLYSESGPGVLAHGGQWRNHKYIRIENGRYIYPDDIKGGLQRSAPPPSKDPKNGKSKKDGKNLSLPGSFGRDVDYDVDAANTYDFHKYINTKPYSSNYTLDEHNKRNLKFFAGNNEAPWPYTSQPFPGITRDVVIDKKLGGEIADHYTTKTKKRKSKLRAEKEVNAYKESREGVKTTKDWTAERLKKEYSDRLGKQNAALSKQKYKETVSSQGPSAAEMAQRNAGNPDAKRSRNTGIGSINVKYKKTKDIKKNKKYQSSVSSQGPSAAEKAQTTRYYSSKINGKWDTPPEAESNNIHGTTRQRMVTYNNKSKGPSAAEMAQRGANGNSRNTDSKTKKKKKLFGR